MTIKLSKHNGLTLMELLITITIIGVVIAFGIPQYENVIRSSRQKAAKTCLALIKNAQDVYFDDNGSYYTAGANVTDVNTNLQLAIIGDFLSYTCSAPTNPANGFVCAATFSGTPSWCCNVSAATDPDCACPAL